MKLENASIAYVRLGLRVNNAIFLSPDGFGGEKKFNHSLEKDPSSNATAFKLIEIV